MSSAWPDSAHVDPSGPEGSARWAASEAQSMEALFAPVPDPRAGYPVPYGPKHQASEYQAYAPGYPAAPQPAPAQPASRRAHREGTRRRRRQWGHDRRTHAMPVVARPVSDRRVALARLAIMITDEFHSLDRLLHLLATSKSPQLTPPQWTGRGDLPAYRHRPHRVHAGLPGQPARLLPPHRCHHRTSRAEMDRFFDRSMPTMTMIVPSYQEDARVIRRTLLSAALQEYPGQRIALLIDDPPDTEPSRPGRCCRRPGRWPPRSSSSWPSRPTGSGARSTSSSRGRSRRHGSDPEEVDSARTTTRRGLAGQPCRPAGDHRPRRRVLRQRGRAGAGRVAAAIALARRDPSARGGLESVPAAQLYRRLGWTFRASCRASNASGTSLSHEPSKAMNLNSYIGLMGGTYREVADPLRAGSRPGEPERTDLIVPDPDYVVNLDADSVLLPEYCLRIVYLLEQSEHQQVGRRSDAVQLVPRCRHPARADRRRHHGHAAHRPPGADLLRRNVLGRCQRRHPQAGAGRDRQDRLQRRRRDPPLHQRPERHRGHRRQHRPRRRRLDADELPRTYELQLDAAGLRLALRVAVVQRGRCSWAHHFG